MHQLHRVIIMFGVTTAVSGFTLACSPTQESKAATLPNHKLDKVTSSLTEAKQPALLLDRGAAKAVSGDYQGAISDYNQALHLDPKNADTYYNRGVAHYYLGQQQQALEDFNQAIGLNPTLAEAYGNRGQLRFDQGDKQGAIQDFQQAAKLFANQGDLAGYQQMQALSEKLQP